MNYNMENQNKSLAEQYEEMKLQHPSLIVLCNYGETVEAYNSDARQLSQLYGFIVTDSERMQSEEGVPWEKISFPLKDYEKYAADMEMRNLRFAVAYSRRESQSQTQKMSDSIGGNATGTAAGTDAVPTAAPEVHAATLAAPFSWSYDKDRDRMVAVQADGSIGATVRPDRRVEFDKNARFTDEQRKTINEFARNGNVIIDGKKLAFSPLSRTGYIYDNPKVTAERMKVVIEEINGEAYAVNGRKLIPSFDDIKEGLRLEWRDVSAEIEQRSQRYLSAFRFRLYQAYMTAGEPEAVAKAEQNVHAAYRYALQEKYTEERAQNEINNIRRMAAQDEWLVYTDEGERTFMIYAKTEEGDKFRPVNLETGKLVGTMAQATHIEKNNLEPVLETLRNNLDGQAQLQVRDTKGKVYYDTEADTLKSLQVSSEFGQRHKRVIVFTPNNVTYGIDVAVEGGKPCLHIRPDRQVVMGTGERLSAANLACIKDFAKTGNMLFNENEQWFVALETTGEPSRYFDDFAGKRRFPVVVETVEGQTCAIHGHEVIARGEQVGYLPEYTAEIVKRFDRKALENYEKCKQAVILADIQGNADADEKAVMDYLDAEKYLYLDRYNRLEAGARLRLIHEAVRMTLSYVNRKSIGQEEMTEQGPEQEAGQKQAEAEDVTPVQETPSQPVHSSGQTGNGNTEPTDASPEPAETSDKAKATEQERQGKQSQGEAGKESIQLFKMDDGHYGICEFKDGKRSHTRRLSDEDTDWFFDGIKDITPQEQEARRRTLAEKYIHQGYKPETLPDVTDEIRKRIGRVNVFRVGMANYNVRAVIDGQQHAGKLIRKADKDLFFANFTGKTKEEKQETLTRLAAVYFKEELGAKEQELDFERGISR